MLSRCFLDFFVGVGAFVIGQSQISTFDSLSPLIHIFREFSRGSFDCLLGGGVQTLLRLLVVTGYTSQHFLISHFNTGE